PPDIAQITFQIVPNSQARISAFQSGQSDMMQETPGIFFKTLAAGGRFIAVPVPISGMGIFAPIDTKKWPTSELAVRKAILYATDKQGVIQLADNGAHPISNTPLEPGMLGYDASLGTMYPYDPAKAEETLKADGWTKNGEFYEKGGKRLTLNITAIATVPEYPLLAQAIQGYLRKVGMDAQVTQLAVPAWYSANLNAEMSMTPLQYVGVDPDALHLWYLPDQYFNFAHFTDPALTEAISQGQMESDPAKRAQLYQQAQKIIMEQALEMPIHLNVDQVMISKNLTGLTWSGGGFEYFGAAQLSK
ncbi:MAG TPA: ABC transporter substrate-binding protein, partial [Acetobacteraceae bacterium]|nr:ABC transporter substrate-binding protein [Acetobacteraceae bacterium]